MNASRCSRKKVDSFLRKATSRAARPFGASVVVRLWLMKSYAWSNSTSASCGEGGRSIPEKSVEGRHYGAGASCIMPHGSRKMIVDVDTKLKICRPGARPCKPHSRLLPLRCCCRTCTGRATDHTQVPDSQADRQYHVLILVF